MDLQLSHSYNELLEQLDPDRPPVRADIEWLRRLHAADWSSHEARDRVLEPVLAKVAATPLFLGEIPGWVERLVPILVRRLLAQCLDDAGFAHASHLCRAVMTLTEASDAVKIAYDATRPYAELAKELEDLSEMVGESAVAYDEAFAVDLRKLARKTAETLLDVDQCNATSVERAMRTATWSADTQRRLSLFHNFADDFQVHSELLTESCEVHAHQCVTMAAIAVNILEQRRRGTTPDTVAVHLAQGHAWELVTHLAEPPERGEGKIERPNWYLTAATLAGIECHPAGEHDCATLDALTDLIRLP